MMPGPVTLGKVVTGGTFQTPTTPPAPMPIYDFKCRSCDAQFEALVLKKAPKCPKCSGEDLERLMSLPAVHTEGTHQRIMANARKADKKTAEEKAHAQRLYEQSHND